MYKTIKKVIVSCISILSITTLLWIALFLNPQWSYAYETNFKYVTVFHDKPLPNGTENVINKAIDILKTSELFNENIHIDLCLNDNNQLYPHLNPLVGNPYAYATLDKTIIKNCSVDFDHNVLTTEWEVNGNELRKFDLSIALAHEFVHNLQFEANAMYVISSTMGDRNWKLEGHAEYEGRGFKDDGRLREKIQFYLIEVEKNHEGIPVFELADNTKQILSYYQYALVVQYLMEVNDLDYFQLCNASLNLDEAYNEMIDWAK